uniref:Uncharacterized protein n=2 Tax=Meloidogyne TaxID=189290 RepID=A0A914L415_MELIC
MSWEKEIKAYLLNFQVLVSISAIFIFLYARKLVRSVAVFYLTGILIGIFASFLIFGHLFQKLIPKFARLPFLFGGWPLSAYIYYLTWRNFSIIFLEYRFYAIIYLGIFTIISLAVCYRMGPPEDERSLNLMEWSLQIIALAIIYFFNQIQEIAYALIFFVIFIFIWRRNADKIFQFSRRNWKKLREFLFGPQPRKLLSEEEYLEESRIYTRMELENLRQFCNSQNSKTNWQLVSRLKRPNRMASFITGDSDHVSAMEFSYHSEIYCQNEGSDEENSYLEEGYITDDD